MLAQVVRLLRVRLVSRSTSDEPTQNFLKLALATPIIPKTPVNVVVLGPSAMKTMRLPCVFATLYLLPRQAA
jgi:hypothetical protein